MQTGVSHSYSYGAVEKTTRAKILGLQDAISATEGSFDDMESEERYNDHYFAPGMYGRKMRIQAGMCVVGKIHKHAHINVLLFGRIKVVTEFGDAILEGSKVWVSEPGTKRAVYALTDCEWLTLHANPTDTQDIREIEEAVIAPDFESFDRLQLESGVIV